MSNHSNLVVRHDHTGSSLKSSITITYLLMAAILVVIAAILLTCLLWKFNGDEFMNANENAAYQLQDSVDTQMMTIFELAGNMGRDTELWSSNVLKDDADLLSAYNAIRRYSLSIDMAQGFYMYYDNTQISHIFTDKSLINKEYFDRIMESLPLNMADMYEMFDIMSGSEHMFLPLKGGRYVASVYMLPTDPCSRRAVLFLLDMLHIQKSVEEAIPSDIAYLKVYSQDGDVIFQKEYGKNATMVLQPLSHNNMALSLEIGITKPKFYEIMSKYSNILLAYIALSIPIGMFMARMLSRKIYRPIYSTRNRIVGGVKNPDDKYSPDDKYTRYQELSDIEAVYRNMSLEKARLTNLVNTQTAALKSGILTTYLGGSEPCREDIMAVPPWEWGIGEKTFIEVALDDLHGYIHGCDAAERVSIEKNIMRAISRIYGICDTYSISSMNDSRQILILAELHDDTPRSRLIEVCRASMKEIHDITGHSVTIAVGEPFDSCEDMALQYALICKLMYMRIETGWNTLLDACNPPELVPRRQAAPQAALIKSACMAADIEAANKELEYYFDMFYEEAPDSATFKSVYFQIYKALSRLAQDITSSQMELAAVEYEPETIVEAMTILKNMLMQICDFVNEEKVHKKVNVSRAAIEYMEEHYNDIMLGPDKMADALNVSRNYLSLCLKEKYGSTASALLDDIRMRHSKRLLEDTNIMVKDIVLAVGYVDVNNYIRKFKRQEGITPLQYRKLKAEYANAHNGNLQ